MTIESLDVVFYTALFILPGFIMNSIIDATNPPPKRTDGILFLKFFSLSIINCACCSWIYVAILARIHNEVVSWLLLLAVTVLGSIVIALIIAIIKQKNWLYIALEKLKLKVIYPTESAWDYYFSQEKESFVIVTLTDDTKIKGRYSSQSFSSSDRENRDLFLEKIYYKEGDKEWIEEKENIGCYIAKDQIKFIEFLEGGHTNGK